MISLLVRGYIGNDFEMNAERQFGYRKKLRTTLLTKWSLPVGPKKLPNPLLLAWRPSGTWHLFFGGVASIWGHLVNFPFKFSCLWAVLFVVLPQRRGRYPMWLFPRAARPELTRARNVFLSRWQCDAQPSKSPPASASASCWCGPLARSTSCGSAGEAS